MQKWICSSSGARECRTAIAAEFNVDIEDGKAQPQK